jgi:hypothetical protein
MIDFLLFIEQPKIHFYILNFRNFTWFKNLKLESNKHNKH